MAGGGSWHRSPGRCLKHRFTTITTCCLHVRDSMRAVRHLPDLVRAESSAGHCWSSMVVSFSWPNCAVAGSSPRSTSRSEDMSPLSHTQREQFRVCQLLDTGNATHLDPTGLEQNRQKDQKSVNLQQFRQHQDRSPTLDVSEIYIRLQSIMS